MNDGMTMEDENFGIDQIVDLQIEINNTLNEETQSVEEPNTEEGVLLSGTLHGSIEELNDGNAIEMSLEEDSLIENKEHEINSSIDNSSRPKRKRNKKNQ